MVDIKSLKVGDRISYKSGEFIRIGEITKLNDSDCVVKNITGKYTGDYACISYEVICDKEIDNKTMENKTIGKSYTFTREELIKTMRDDVIEMLKDNVAGLVDGSVEIGFFENWQDIDNKDTNDLIQWWCDMYSDSFFEANPDVDDALILTEKKGNDTFKEWMASR